MKVVVLVGLIAGLALCSSAAAAWDPSGEGITDPAPDAPWVAEPAPVVPPPGIYLVTETYAGDTVTHDGVVTTYSTETVHETTGSYARVLESVGTGGSSAFDGAAFNGRAAMTDGRAVAGTYYENYVRTDTGFVPVSVVFFQDDEEIARASRTPVPTAPPIPPLTDFPVWNPGGPDLFASDPEVLPRRGAVDPIPVAPDLFASDPEPVVRRRPALINSPLPDEAIEVLRSRRTEISFARADARGWRLVSGDVVVLGPTSGAAYETFIARWDRLAPPGGAWVVRIAIEFADGATRELAIRVTVRAPGLVE